MHEAHAQAAEVARLQRQLNVLAVELEVAAGRQAHESRRGF